MELPRLVEMLIPTFEEVGVWGYLLIFLLVALESVVFIGFFLPGESLLLFVGFLVAQDILPFHLGVLIGTVTFAAIAGNTVSYYLGRSHFRPLMQTRFGTHWQGLLHEGENFFERHGGKSVFLARFTGVFRSIIPLIAGLTKMKWVPFLAWNVGGAVVWSTLFLLLGFYAGEAAAALFERSSRIIVGIGIFFLLALLFYFGFRREKKVEEKGEHNADIS